MFRGGLSTLILVGIRPLLMPKVAVDSLDKETSARNSSVCGSSGGYSYSSIRSRRSFIFRSFSWVLRNKVLLFLSKALLFLSTTAESELSGYFECPTALAEADEPLLAVGDTLFAAADGGRGWPSIVLKRSPPARCMAGRVKSPPPMLASVMAVGSLRDLMLFELFYVSNENTKSYIRLVLLAGLDLSRPMTKGTTTRHLLLTNFDAWTNLWTKVQRFIM